VDISHININSCAQYVLDRECPLSQSGATIVVVVVVVVLKPHGTEEVDKITHNLPRLFLVSSLAIRFFCLPKFNKLFHQPTIQPTFTISMSLAIAAACNAV
jgi:branched-subunit amino acid permease